MLRQESIQRSNTPTVSERSPEVKVLHGLSEPVQSQGTPSQSFYRYLIHTKRVGVPRCEEAHGLLQLA
jgi:hypothetical protein